MKGHRRASAIRMPVLFVRAALANFREPYSSFQMNEQADVQQTF